MQKKTLRKPAAAASRKSRGWMERLGAQRSLKRAMSDFDKVEVAEPAVKPKRGETRAIKRAVRAFYGRDALERA